ncbi:MAG: 50S ribosomal protein L7Ae [Candidatus Heimdallarchaeum aukensis]|uniref:Large ribosomal subunit protein eL8 n=1 Tax=Candidatus Heimdallarchaeum aukensis TaxID=2876573 RepID=A0A9Y1BI82_9ARCH|nr:MAG: 50S ribosomal protein L7Ae [Candidatus Heimdallarchaeum aukensis]
MAIYKKFEIPEELVKESLNILENAAKTGEVRKGTNEVTKAVERKTASMVYIAEDVEPPEIVMHLPLLCEENKIPYTFVPTKEELGKAVGLSVGSASIAVVKAGEAKSTLESLAQKIAELKK